MREILFRGKRSNDEWVYGYYLVNEYVAEYEHKIHFYRKGLFGMGTVIVKSKTIGQYTGLKDKNEVKIFEGDIVSIYCGFHQIEHIAIIEYESLFCLYRANIQNLCNSKCVTRGIKDCKVIGNIHENPELLRKD